MEQTAEHGYGLGRRKRSIARVRLMPKGSGKMTVNGKALEAYLPVEAWRTQAVAPLVATGTREQFDVDVRVSGGGLSGQADAIRLGVARALVAWNPDIRLAIKKVGYLRRDARKKERKKFGHKKARRSPQWSKR